MCRAVYADFSLLWIGAYSRNHALGPGAAGHFRRRPGPGRTGDSGGHVPSQQARLGIRPVHDRHCDGSGDRTGAGRVDHRQLQLALDIFHQHSDRLLSVLSRQPAS